MSKTRRYESTTQAEQLQISQADRLRKGQTKWNDRAWDFSIPRWFLSFGAVGALSSIVSLSGYPVLFVAFVIVLSIVVWAIWQQFTEGEQRFPFGIAIAAALLAAIDWYQIFVSIKGVFDR